MKEVAVRSEFLFVFLFLCQLAMFYISKGEERYSFFRLDLWPATPWESSPTRMLCIVDTNSCRSDMWDGLCVYVCCLFVCVFVFVYVLLNLQASAEKMSECFLGACIRGV